MARRRAARYGKPDSSGQTHRRATEAEGPTDRWRPWLLGAACGLWVVRPLYPSEGAALRGDGLPVVMLWLALAVLWALGRVGRRELRLRFGWVDAGLLLAIGWHTLAALWAATYAWSAGAASPRPAVNMLWEWIGLGVGFFLTRQLVDGQREARALIAVMIALAVALACYGPYQTYYEMAKDRELYRINPDEALRRAGIWYPEGSPGRETFQKRLESMEPLGTFALTNSLAGYLAPWLVVMVGIGASALAGQSRQQARWLIGLAAAALPVVACLILTKSRSAYLATLAGMVLLAIAGWRQRLRVSWRVLAVGTAAVAVLVAAAIALRALDVEVLTEARKSLSYRLEYWTATMAMIRDHPWLGCGPGNYRYAYEAYKLPQASEEVADPHNFLLEIWATAGTPAMLAFVAAIAGFFWVVAKDATRGGAGRPSGQRETSSLRQTQRDLLRTTRVSAEGQTGMSRPPRRQTGMSALLPWFVFGGAAVGFLAAIPIALLTGAPAQYAVLYVGLPPAIATGAILTGWVQRGRISAGLAAVGLVVLLVNLLAAGGVGLPSVAGTLWILVAVGLSLLEPEAARPRPRGTAMGLLAASVGLSIACYATGYSPVLRCYAAMESARSDPSHQEVYLREAALADPLSAEPWSQLAAVAFDGWRHAVERSRRQNRMEADAATAATDLLERLEEYTKAVLDRTPNSSPDWLAAAERYQEIGAGTGKLSYLDKSIDFYRRAIRLYPNSVVCHGRMALALLAAGDTPGARKEAATALRLNDDLKEHPDKQLDSDLRKSLERIDSKRN